MSSKSERVQRSRWKQGGALPGAQMVVREDGYRGFVFWRAAEAAVAFEALDDNLPRSTLGSLRVVRGFAVVDIVLFRGGGSRRRP